MEERQTVKNFFKDALALFTHCSNVNFCKEWHKHSLNTMNSDIKIKLKIFS